MSLFNNHYLQLPDHFYQKTDPEPLTDAQLIHCNELLLDELSLQLEPETLLQMTSGNRFPSGITPIAQKYTGHQFGYYNPDLGDGRGLLLGQIKDSEDKDWDLHLKGSGRTAFSRSGDGRAVLRSAIREYIIGEALHGLGIPTSRCLSLCHSSEAVQREQLEDRASYIRVAKTHIRFGHFEWLAQLGDAVHFKALANYVIETVYPELKEFSETQRYSVLLNKITEKTALLMTSWQASGFCHGVMNTDNMSVAGETFDFGPYAFLDDCKIHYVCNHSDTDGRYAYSQQPNIGLWNCQALGQAFSLILTEAEIDDAINRYITTFNQSYLEKMRAKLGLIQPHAEDKHFIADTLTLMDESNLDFHYFFQQLAHFSTDKQSPFMAYLPESEAWDKWVERYEKRIQLEKSETSRVQLINNNTPKLVLRNYIAQEIIDAAEQKDYSHLNRWMQWLQSPYALPNDFNSELQEYYLQPPNLERKNLILSCSS